MYILRLFVCIVALCWSGQTRGNSLDLFWRQLLVLGQITAVSSPSHAQKKDTSFDATIATFAQRALALEDKSDETALATLYQDFYETVSTVCSVDVNHNARFRKLDRSEGDYLAHATYLLYSCKERLYEDGASVRTFKDLFWGSRFSVTYTPMIIKNLLRFFYFGLLGGSVHEQVQLITAIAQGCTQTDNILLVRAQKRLFWLLYANMFYGFFDIVAGQLCEWYRLAQQLPMSLHSPAPMLNAASRELTNRSCLLLGYEHEQKRLHAQVVALQNPLKTHYQGHVVPRGILISGPSGVGKTTFLHSVAAQAHCFVYTVHGMQLTRDPHAIITSSIRYARTIAPVMLHIENFDVIENAAIRNDILRVVLEEYQPSLYYPITIVMTIQEKPSLVTQLLQTGLFETHISLASPDLSLRQELWQHYGVKPDVLEPAYVAGLTEGFLARDMIALARYTQYLFDHNDAAQAPVAVLQEAVKQIHTQTNRFADQ